MANGSLDQDASFRTIGGEAPAARSARDRARSGRLFQRSWL